MATVVTVIVFVLSTALFLFMAECCWRESSEGLKHLMYVLLLSAGFAEATTAVLKFIMSYFDKGCLI